MCICGYFGLDTCQKWRNNYYQSNIDIPIKNTWLLYGVYGIATQVLPLFVENSLLSYICRVNNALRKPFV